MDSTEEVTGSLVLAGGEAAILSELVEEWLDQVPRPIQMLVIITRLFAAPLEWNRNAFVHILQGIDDSRLGIESWSATTVGPCPAIRCVSRSSPAGTG
jgi:hypothetical protein